MLNRFRQPYPVQDQASRKWVTALATGVFISFFLLLFRPFGLESLPLMDAPLLIAGYGLVTFICILLNLFVIPKVLPQVFREERWTVGSEFLFTLWIVFTIGICNAYYTAFIYSSEVTLLGFVNFQLITIAVAIFPVTILILIKQNRLLRNNQKHADDLSVRIRRFRKSEEEKKVVLSGENSDDKLLVCVNDILFLTAADNYIEVVYVNAGVVEKKLLRSTLKIARMQLKEYSSFYRCHRSWIVNLDRIRKVNGNAQGYRLLLDQGDTEIPVSRSLNKELESRLAK